MKVRLDFITRILGRPELGKILKGYLFWNKNEWKACLLLENSNEGRPNLRMRMAGTPPLGNKNERITVPGNKIVSGGG
jgi:hypothetical protein